MKTTKFIIIVLILAGMLTAVSCSWFQTPFEFDRKPDFFDVYHPNTDESTDPSDLLQAPEDTGIPNVTSDAINILGDNLQFHYLDSVNCVVVYNEQNAWMFDYKLEKITPLVDPAAMLADADPSGRGTEYFDDVRISYEFNEKNGVELRITYTVTSNTAEAEYKVYSFYTLGSDADYVRGDVRGYYIISTEYPGCDEPLGVYDISDYAKLGIDEENYLYKVAKAIVENDVQGLEKSLFLDEGTLADWEGMVIDEYELIREDMSSYWLPSLTLKVNITESKLERCPAGKYTLVISEGITVDVQMIPDGEIGKEREFSGAEEWLYSFVRHYGDSSALAETAIGHYLIDYYLGRLSIVGGEPVYEDFLKFADICFGFEIDEDVITREDIENHGGHGIATVLCGIETTASSSGIHKIKVTYFADPMMSVVSQIEEFCVVETGDERFGYRFESGELLYSSGLRTHGWST